MPLQRRLPKRGFHNPFRVQMSVVNLSQLEAFAAEASEIGPENLAAHGLIAGKNRRVKILGEGSLSRPLTVKAHGFSASAKDKIEAAGGKAELIAVYA
jgi:large subunit ribosomal protein L15